MLPPGAPGLALHSCPLTGPLPRSSIVLLPDNQSHFTSRGLALLAPLSRCLWGRQGSGSPPKLPSITFSVSVLLSTSLEPRPTLASQLTPLHGFLLAAFTFPPLGILRDPGAPRRCPFQGSGMVSLASSSYSLHESTVCRLLDPHPGPTSASSHLSCAGDPRKLLLLAWPVSSPRRRGTGEMTFSKVLGTRSGSNLEFFQILEYFHKHNEVSWEWDPSLNIRFIYVSYTPYTPLLKVILHIIFDNWVHETQILWCGIFYMWSNVSTQKRFRF